MSLPKLRREDVELLQSHTNSSCSLLDNDGSLANGSKEILREIFEVRATIQQEEQTQPPGEVIETRLTTSKSFALQSTDDTLTLLINKFGSKVDICSAQRIVFHPY